MTSIADPLLVRNCRGYRFFGSFRERQSTSRQNFFNTRDNAMEEATLAEAIPAGYANIPLRFLRIL
jgi:hypothetical protein